MSHADHGATGANPDSDHGRPSKSIPAHGQLYPEATPEVAAHRTRLAPGPAEAFRAFSNSVFAAGALPAKTKQLIAVAVAHVTQCPYCIRSHTRDALRHGATGEEIMEAIWVAAEMRAGGSYAHSALALDTISRHQASHPAQSEGDSDNEVAVRPQAGGVA